MELIKELGLDVHQQYSTGAKFARLSDGKVRKYSSSLPKISPFSLLDIFFFINKVRVLVIMDVVMSRGTQDDGGDNGGSDSCGK